MKSEELLARAKQMQDTIVENRRYLHMHPGTGFDIQDTVSFVKKEVFI